jgi:hypothetical protein
MSEEGGFGLGLAEKFFGLVVFIVGIVTLFYTLTSTGSLLAFAGLFGFLSLLLIMVGLVLITAKTE